MRSCLRLPVIRSYLMWTAGNSPHCNTLEWKRYIKTSPLSLKEKRKMEIVIIKLLWYNDEDWVLQIRKRLENEKYRTTLYSQQITWCWELIKQEKTFCKTKCLNTIKLCPQIYQAIIFFLIYVSLPNWAVTTHMVFITIIMSCNGHKNKSIPCTGIFYSVIQLKVSGVLRDSVNYIWYCSLLNMALQVAPNMEGIIFSIICM